MTNLETAATSPTSRPAPRLPRAGVVGCGQMGAGIAEVCARAGLAVHVVEPTTTALQAGWGRINASLERALTRGRLSNAQWRDCTERLDYTTDIADLADCDLLFEAAVEHEDIKTDIFRALDDVVTNPDAVLASATSSIPLINLAVATARPDRVIGHSLLQPRTRPAPGGDHPRPDHVRGHL